SDETPALWPDPIAAILAGQKDSRIAPELDGLAPDPPRLDRHGALAEEARGRAVGFRPGLQLRHRIGLARELSGLVHLVELRRHHDARRVRGNLLIPAAGAE